MWRLYTKQTTLLLEPLHVWLSSPNWKLLFEKWYAWSFDSADVNTDVMGYDKFMFEWL